MADETFFIDRRELERVFNSAAARSFEDMQRRVSDTEAAATANVDATTGLVEATYVTLSANTELPNEFVLSVGDGLRLVTADNSVTLYSDAPRAVHFVRFVTAGDTEVVLPLNGILVTRAGTETLSGKTLASPSLSGLGNYVDDAAAAGGGVPVGGVYRNGSQLMVRVA